MTAAAAHGQHFARREHPQHAEPMKRPTMAPPQ